MADLTFKTALAANELVAGTPGAGQEQITGAEVVGATSASNADSGWTFTSLRSWVITHPDLMLKSEYDNLPTNGIVNAAASVETDLGASKSAQQIVDHLNDLSIHRALNDSQTTTINLWSANKINSELATKASSTALTNHTGNTNNPHSTLHSQLSDKGTNTHAQIDLHIGNTTGNPHSVTHLQLPDKGANTHAQIDSHLASSANPHSVTHAQLPDKGANTHAQIDAHVNSTANPHGVTAAQINAAPLSHVGDSTHLSTDERNAINNAVPAPTGANPFATEADLVDIQWDGAPVTRREIINFTGAGVSVVDNDPAQRTDILIPGGGGGSKHTIADDVQTYADRTILRFQGTGVTVADNEPGDATEVTITAGGGGGGDVTSPDPSIAGNLSAFRDTTGKVIEDAGYAMPAGGAINYVLTKQSAGDYDWVWAEAPAGGNVNGPEPAASTDDAVALWDGTGGRTLKENSALLGSDIISKGIANQYASLAQKASPVNGDWLLLEDSEDATVGAKKKVLLGSLPGGGGTVGEAPADGQNYVRNGLTGSWNRGLRVFTGAADPGGNANLGDIWMDPN